jgi:hypothetical protein
MCWVNSLSTGSALLPGLRPESGSLGELFGHWQLVTIYAPLPVAIAVLRASYQSARSVGSFFDSPRSATATGSVTEVRRQLLEVMRQAQLNRRGIPRRRIVIFVDDLDRCPAAKALETCDAASQLLGYPGIVTVLAADLDFIETAAVARYKSTETDSESRDYAGIGEDYLQRLVQVRFDLPPLYVADIREAMSHLSARTDSRPEGQRSRQLQLKRTAEVALMGISLAAPAAVGGYSALVGIGSGLDLASDAAVGSVLIVFLIAIGRRLRFVLSSMRSWSERRRSRLETADHISDGHPGDAADERTDAGGELDQTVLSLADYLPSDVRGAKRLANHLKLFISIAGIRGTLGGNPELTLGQLVKWVVIIERWPKIAQYLMRDPDKMAVLEQSANVSDLLGSLTATAPVVHAADELLQIIRQSPPLAGVLCRLIQFTPSTPAAPQQSSARDAEDISTSHANKHNPRQTRRKRSPVLPRPLRW